MSIGILRTAVESAQAALDKLIATRRKLDARAMAASEELASLRAVSGDAILDELDAGSGKRGAARRRILDLEGDITDLVSARRACCLRISKAILALGKAKSDAKRGEAKPFEAELAKYTAERDRLLGLLRAHTEIDWAPREPWTVTSSIPGLPDVGKFSNGTRLQMQIGELHRAADQIEQAAAAQAAGGRVDGASTPAELLAKIAEEPLAPSISDVTMWVDGHRRGASEYTRSEYTLVWTASGEIEASQSKAVHQMAPGMAFAAAVHAPHLADAR